MHNAVTFTLFHQFVDICLEFWWPERKTTENIHTGNVSWEQCTSVSSIPGHRSLLLYNTVIWLFPIQNSHIATWKLCHSQPLLMEQASMQLVSFSSILCLYFVSGWRPLYDLRVVLYGQIRTTFAEFSKEMLKNWDEKGNRKKIITQQTVHCLKLTNHSCGTSRVQLYSDNTQPYSVYHPFYAVACESSKHRSIHHSGNIEMDLLTMTAPVSNKLAVYLARHKSGNINSWQGMDFITIPRLESKVRHLQPGTGSRQRPISGQLC